MEGITEVIGLNVDFIDEEVKVSSEKGTLTVEQSKATNDSKALRRKQECSIATQQNLQNLNLSPTLNDLWESIFEGASTGNSLEEIRNTLAMMPEPSRKIFEEFVLVLSAKMPGVEKMSTEQIIQALQKTDKIPGIGCDHCDSELPDYNSALLHLAAGYLMWMMEDDGQLPDDDDLTRDEMVELLKFYESLPLALIDKKEKLKAMDAEASKIEIQMIIEDVYAKFELSSSEMPAKEYIESIMERLEELREFFTQDSKGFLFCEKLIETISANREELQKGTLNEAIKQLQEYRNQLNTSIFSK